MLKVPRCSTASGWIFQHAPNRILLLCSPKFRADEGFSSIRPEATAASTIPTVRTQYALCEGSRSTCYE